MDLTLPGNLSVTTDFTQYDLSIQAGLDGFSFFAGKEDTGEIILQHHIDFVAEKENFLLRKIREIINDHKVLQETFRTTTIYLAERSFTLIPEPYFSEKLVHYPFTLKQKASEERETIVLPLHHLNAVFAFSTDRNLADFFPETFPGCLISHEIIPAIQQSIKKGGSSINFLIHESWFYALVVKNGEIDLVNTFEYRNEADMLFFVLTIINHYNIDNIDVFVSGRGDDFANKYQLLRKYIPRAEVFHFLPEGITGGG